MISVRAEYLGQLRSQATHLASNTTIITDAPIDNQGKGESFSPTDLCAAALATCAMTVIGIYAEKNALDVVGMKIELEKVMMSDPRRIGRIEISLTMPATNYSNEDKLIIEDLARSCPVFYSLNEELDKIFHFIWA